MFHRIIFLLLIVSSLSCNFNRSSVAFVFIVYEHRLQEYLKGLVHDNAHARPLSLQNKIAITGTIIENPSFYSDTRRFGWSSYTSVVVIKVWLCRLTGYVLRRHKK